MIKIETWEEDEMMEIRRDGELIFCGNNHDFESSGPFLKWFVCELGLEAVDIHNEGAWEND